MLPLAERRRQLAAAHPCFRRWLPAICAAYLAALAGVGGLGPEHLATVLIVLFFALFSDGTRRLARVVYPFLLYGAVYDSMRWYADYIRAPVVHLHEPFDFDLRFFGIATAHGLLTPNQWLQLHTSKVLDFFCGLAYTPFLFIGESALLTLWLYFHGQERRAIRFAWVFTVANFLGFSFYYTYPAAPPWYVAAHGFVADFTVRASPAGAIRFDQLIGIPLMQTFYGKSADVFGAVPSLHIVYPFLALCYGIWLPRFRWVASGYFLLVCFAAVYLDHHYIFDIIAGLAVALTVMAAFRYSLGPLDRPAAADPALARVPEGSAPRQGTGQA